MTADPVLPADQTGQSGRVLRVHLADAPTDVLVWLAEQQADRYWTSNGIARGAAPDDADDALRSTLGAISTLFGCGFIEGRNVDGISMFRATDEGRSAVAAARLEVLDV